MKSFVRLLKKSLVIALTASWIAINFAAAVLALFVFLYEYGEYNTLASCAALVAGGLLLVNAGKSIDLLTQVIKIRTIKRSNSLVK